MKTHLQILGHHHSTPRAHLRGVARIYSDNFATSLLHFVAKQLLELAQPRIGCAEGQVRVPEHKLEGEVFNSDQAVGIGKLPGDLVPEVPTPVLSASQHATTWDCPGFLRH